MPRFYNDGPMVPDRLVHQLEDDRVVVFCGAGISMGAGLPDFKGLVKYCYDELGYLAPAETSPDWLWLDRMLGTLENRFGGAAMRKLVVERLNRTAGDLTLHKAILDIAKLKGPSGGYRLVTTNFDLLFEQAQPSLIFGHDYHSGPILPIPRNDRSASWRSIVYLHGRLDERGDNNDHLVLTSADFGRAYLTEAWAARFVARLFAEFTVLFIGYSLNDPVLRYMTDAFAAEDALSRSGRKRDPAYIFVSHPGLIAPDPGPWRDRRLEPIFYREAYNHRALNRTLIEWADARQDYLTRVRQVITRTASSQPSSLEPSDLSNALWAILGREGDGGQGARIFRELAPPAPFEWLVEFERRDADLKVQHAEDTAESVREGREPPPPPALHFDPLFPSRLETTTNSAISESGREIIQWFVTKLDDPKLVDWMILKSRDRRPHALLRFYIRKRLDEAPATPEGMALFWRIVASEGAWATNTDLSFPPNDLEAAIARDRSAPWLIQEVRSAMRPYLTFSRSLRSVSVSGAALDPTRLSHVADPEVLISEENVPHIIDWIEATPDPDRWWAERLEMLTDRLRQVFDLYAVVGEASIGYDPSIFSRPSIVPHAQNSGHVVWSRLFDLIWRGWTLIDSTDAPTSREWIERWRRIDYLAFRRLTLAAVAHTPNMTPDEKLEVLLHG